LKKDPLPLEISEVFGGDVRSDNALSISAPIRLVWNGLLDPDYVPYPQNIRDFCGLLKMSGQWMDDFALRYNILAQLEMGHLQCPKVGVALSY
jgi:hypothetical protein